MAVCLCEISVIQYGTKRPVLNWTNHKCCWHWRASTVFKSVFTQILCICISLINNVTRIKANELKFLNQSTGINSTSHYRITPNKYWREVNLIMKSLNDFFIFLSQSPNVAVIAWIKNEISSELIVRCIVS